MSTHWHTYVEHPSFSFPSKDVVVGLLIGTGMMGGGIAFEFIESSILDELMFEFGGYIVVCFH